MPPVIPPPLAAYIQSCLSANNQILITSVLNTPSAWLSLRLVFAALRGVEDHDARGRPHDARATTTDNDEGASRGIIILSLFRPLSLWVEMGKKLVRFMCLSDLVLFSLCQPVHEAGCSSLSYRSHLTPPFPRGRVWISPLHSGVGGSFTLTAWHQLQPRSPARREEQQRHHPFRQPGSIRLTWPIYETP